ncbi:MAG TPA: LysM peptidoglycan-binding domain-containing M23 family metallopeptidase [Anaerolineales bacterium]|nr:LysM peptidoglycan-binding domain-containing M23 family metallopeptidase [Anaerolineales bacterium]
MRIFKSATNSPSSKLARSVLLIAVILAFAAGVAAPAAAQESSGVRYVVQPGDTLSSIAVRFDVSWEEIANANNLANPNNLNVGDVLLIPGIDWIEGTLVLEPMPLGESYLSLKRRYFLTDGDMARLNRFSTTSPEQIYAGFQVMLATERGELTDSARAAVSVGQSLLELAATSGDNPWRLAAVNQLPGTWAAIPGDVLFTPGREGEGPGGLPSPITSLTIDDSGFVQGHTAVLSISGAGDLDLGGELVGHPLHFFSEGDSNQVALQGIPLEAEGETTTFSISGTLASGAAFLFSQPVRIQSGGFARANLFVDPEFLDGERSVAENAQVAQLMAAVTEEKMWSGLWGWPHDLVDDVTSEFGVYRTYNGGLSESFHYGVDFGGGALLAIYAPAPGRVVFAGPMDIRGNATIIDHGWGVFTAYYHQEEVQVQVGDLVEPGQIIGIVGKSGRVSGPHLHWEVWVNGVPVEPLDWLALVFP